MQQIAGIQSVIPAQAGIYYVIPVETGIHYVIPVETGIQSVILDSCLRRNDDMTGMTK